MRVLSRFFLTSKGKKLIKPENHHKVSSYPLSNGTLQVYKRFKYRSPFHIEWGVYKCLKFGQ